MSDMKMKPVIPVPKRAHGFSIDSIMRRDDTDRRSSPISSSDDSDQGDDIPRHTNSPDEPHRSAVGSRIPPLHPSLPPHVQQLLLADASGRGNSELLALRSQAWAFGNQSIGGYPTVAVNGTGIGMPPHLGHGLHTPGLPVHPGLLASSRDPFAMYPWMVARQGPGLMGFPYGHPDAGLLFHPYRKPKRIRTAFSPSQLLKLEHAFEKNHYVVGQERKELAAKLSLTETQVKVWFQNRRTKHKRVRSDDEGESGNISIDDDETATSSANCDETSQVSYVEQSS